MYLLERDYEMNLGGLLHSKAIKKRRKTALLSHDCEVSYRDLDETSSRLARWFLQQGLRPGDRVAIHWPDSIQTVQLYFAAFKAGLVAVPVNLRLKPAEIDYIFDQSRPLMCISEPSLAPLAEQAGQACQSTPCIVTEVDAEGTLEASSTPLPEVDENEPAVILYTSGTTAQPKGVTHSHRSLLASARLVAAELLASDDIALATTSLLHISGLSAVLLPAISVGATVVLLPDFEPAAVLDAIERFRVTYTGFLPAVARFAVEEQARNRRDVSSLRTVIAAGDSVPETLQRRFRKLFGTPLREGYGMTETGFITLNRKRGLRPGSLGRAVAGVEVRIVNPAGMDAQEGETGEIVVRSLSNCVGYWNDPTATADLLRGGWLRMGDLGCRDSAGHYWFQGRLKQVIVRGGSNVSPQEVEEALYRHPEVLEAGVVGQPDAVYGERVVAFVRRLSSVGAVDEARMREFVREFLADYKVPDRIMFVAELPKGPTGKLDRRMMKEMLLSSIFRDMEVRSQQPEVAVAAIG